MADVSMRKLILVGNSSERKELMKTIHRLGCVETCKTSFMLNTGEVNVEERKDEVQLKLARLTFAFNMLKDSEIAAKKLAKDKSIEYKPQKKEMFAPRPRIEFDDFAACPDKEEEIFATIDELAGYSDELTSIKSQSVKLKNLKETYAPYTGFDAPLDIVRDTANTVAYIGTALNANADKLESAISATDGVMYEKSAGKSVSAFIIVALKEKKEELAELMTTYEFAPLTTLPDKRAAQVIEECDAELEELESRRRAVIENTMEKRDMLQSYKLLYDYYTLEMQKVAAEEGMKGTSTSYVLEGWIPAMDEAEVDKTLSESPLTLAYMLRDPEEGEIPPTLCVNNGVVTPYQSVTNMFSVPRYGELNPNPFVAFFFFVFFGIMLADVGYGVLLVLGASFVLWRMKPKKGEGNLVKIILMGGISSTFWGIMFGSYFGEQLIPAVIFNPLDEPMGMLILSIVMGLVQMLFGMGINAYILFRDKKPADAIFGVFSWYALFIGLAMFALGGKIAAVKYTGIAFLALGLIGMLIAGALHKKGIKKISGAFGNLYGIVNFFSDLLSYTRLFGLGLASSVIAMVLNQIATVMVQLIPVIGVVVAAVILVGGHLFNLGINALGAYVHNSRLQFVEFFGKFYVGGGRSFSPLGSHLKYYSVEK